MYFEQGWSLLCKQAFIVWCNVSAKLWNFILCILKLLDAEVSALFMWSQEQTTTYVSALYPGRDGYQMMAFAM